MPKGVVDPFCTVKVKDGNGKGFCFPVLKICVDAPFCRGIRPFVLHAGEGIFHGDGLGFRKFLLPFHLGVDVADCNNDVMASRFVVIHGDRFQVYIYAFAAEDHAV